MLRKVLAGIAFVAIVGGALAAARTSDAEVLTRVGRTTAAKVMAAMPDREQVAGPLAKAQFGTLTGVADRVRVRLRTDAAMDGARITVSAEGGVVKLGGKADTAAQRERAVLLAQTTTGVTKVDQEIAVPVGK
jgi:osmotically-inducible protein OsmY